MDFLAASARLSLAFCMRAEFVFVDLCDLELIIVNSGLTQGSVLSVTYFLLLINDMLPLGCSKYYKDNTTKDILE